MLGFDLADQDAPEWYSLTSDGTTIELRIHPEAWSGIHQPRFYELAGEQIRGSHLGPFAPLENERVGFDAVLERVEDPSGWTYLRFSLPKQTATKRGGANELRTLIAFCHSLHLLLLFLNAQPAPTRDVEPQLLSIQTGVTTSMTDWTGAWAIEAHLSPAACRKFEQLFAQKGARRGLVQELDTAYSRVLADDPPDPEMAPPSFVDVRYSPPKHLIIEAGGASIGICFASRDARHLEGLAHGTILTTHNCDHPAYQTLLLVGLGIVTRWLNRPLSHPR